MNKNSALPFITKLIGIAVKKAGQPPHELYKHCDISLEDLSLSTTTISLDKMDKLWLEAASITNDPFIGFKVGELLQPAMLRALGFSWLASKNVYEGLQRLVKFSSYITGRVQFTLTKVGTEVHLNVINAFPEYPLSTASIDFIFMVVTKMSEITLNERLVPLRFVCSPVHVKSRSEIKFKQLIGCPFELKPMTTTIVFDSQIAFKPLMSWDAEFTKLNDQLIKDYSVNIATKPYTKLVTQYIIENISTGPLNQKKLADKLNQSTKTLHRKLERENTSYLSLVNETKLKLAKNYLRSDIYAIKEISWLLGYQNTSAFNKAFKQWTSLTPGEFIKKTLNDYD